MFNLSAAIWICSSIFFSTCVISLNKYISRTFNFDFMTSLTAFHFITTYFLLEIMCRIGLFERATQYPIKCRWRLAAYGVSSVVFMNYNLARNSVGFYQLSKMCNIPTIVIYNFFIKNVTTPLNKLIALAILLTGVGLYSVNDVELNFGGTIIAIIAVISTACFQITAGSDQKEFSMSGPQVQHASALQQFILCFIAAIVTEFFNPKHTIMEHPFSQREIMLIGLTGVIAVGVNVSCFGIIGKTSALTYQVVGHVKTTLILLIGFVFFPPKKTASHSQTVKTAIGMAISMVGIIMYTSIGLMSKDDNKGEGKSKPSILENKEDDEEKHSISNKDEKHKEEKPLPGNLFPPMGVDDKDNLENPPIDPNPPADSIINQPIDQNEKNDMQLIELEDIKNS